MEVVRDLHVVCDEYRLIINVLVVIAVGFLTRIYFLYKERWEYSREIASKKVTNTVLFMILLAVVLENEFINIPDNVETILGGLVVSIYLVMALIGSMDSDNLRDNTIISFVKFALIYLLSVSDYVLIIVITSAFAIGIILLYRKQIIETDGDKITVVEILLLCIENFIVSLFMLFSIDNTIVFSVIIKVAFEETVLYSFNYIVLFVMKEKIYLS